MRIRREEASGSKDRLILFIKRNSHITRVCGNYTIELLVGFESKCASEFNYTNSAR